MSRISSYITLSSIFIFGYLAPTFAQNKKPVQVKDSTKLWQGVLLEVDVVPLVQAALPGSGIYAFQGHAQLNLKNKYFPVIEAGTGGANKTADNDIQYKSYGVFGKLGLDVPIIKPKVNSNNVSNYAIGGVRLGMSQFNYSYSNLSITDNYWGGTETLEMKSDPTSKFWFEIVGGIRVDIFKNIYMGWNVRHKFLINKTKPEMLTPWYIPGFGIENGSGWSMSYTVGYKIK